MKDIFDKCKFGDFTLNSRIIRTGLWESQTTKNGGFTPEIYERYEKIASSGVGLINQNWFHYILMIFLPNIPIGWITLNL